MTEVKGEFFKQNGFELVMRILTKGGSSPKIDTKCFSILHDFLHTEALLFPTAPHLIAEQVVQAGLIPASLDRLLHTSLIDFFLQDKILGVLEYMKEYKAEVVLQYDKEISQLMEAFKQEAAKDSKFQAAFLEQIEKFGKLLH